jgi:hypothetical protein
MSKKLIDRKKLMKGTTKFVRWLDGCFGVTYPERPNNYFGNSRKKGK